MYVYKTILYTDCHSLNGKLHMLFIKNSYTANGKLIHGVENGTNQNNALSV